jgi:hypothetical protein
MLRARYEYPTEKLSAARRILMVPLFSEEAQVMADAFSECDLALMHLGAQSCR